ncbi:bifunctional 5,10-methylenetetrahydrofolate dehydrogenase/5,10-methenyltetrahydrofolate cyclohydrolase [Labrys wisconsinensis]|uniref:Bifunctional protein FolD n=1 Tax=Labrys wisconsinensis TaxID=425677 RepID=A0ABU0JHC3_9HYPH|nr:bifunctional 5,10-methylenetetrahydrofolate dehydrogenase/5,10-methenyltetrahydrofolate cyclohydrolase [Labrys wisconsinensis]MDQ0472634.1 methylenetetrahydrofolate dehydrogenase (NADP+)/methenyltetrahydrofolate cyclohydrolase [Labrys wisconsinensis]
MVQSHPHDLRGKPIADAIIAEVRRETEMLAAAGWHPRLLSISIGDVEAAAVYIRNQKRQAERAGIAFEERNFPASITQAELEVAIRAMNADPRVTGIIIQRPAPAHIALKALQGAVHPMKDVEGMHPASIGNIVYNQLDLAPCTAAASVELLKATGLKLEGLEVVVVGHSEIVGKPIAFLLMSEGATVTVCHHMTRSVAIHARRADALFVAVGKARLITAEMVKPGAAVIDIGINVVKDAEGRESVIGDVDTDSVREVAAWITPVPGGVGPVTVAILLRNALTALKRQRTLYETAYREDVGR